MSTHTHLMGEAIVSSFLLDFECSRQPGRVTVTVSFEERGSANPKDRVTLSLSDREARELVALIQAQLPTERDELLSALEAQAERAAT